MRPRRLFWQLFPSYLLIVLLAVIAVAGYASLALRDTYMEQTATYLTTQAKLAAQTVSESLAQKDFEQVDAICKAIGNATESRISVILPDGVVAGDSEGDAHTMENHRERPEIAAALAGTTGSATRFSSTLQREMLYIAVPVGSEPSPDAAVRVAVPLVSVHHTLGSMYLRVAMAVIAVSAIAAVLALIIVRQLSRPLEHMTSLAKEFAEGALHHRVTVHDSEGFSGLGVALNSMAEKLDSRIREVVRQHNELEAVLESMVEGVIAVGADDRVLSMNRAAGLLLRLDPERAAGRPLREVVRNPELQDLAARMLASHGPLEGEVVLYEGSERYLQVHGNSLYDAQQTPIGAVLVLNDTTHVRRLESVRRDFVANVSHEIRTPITSIKGYVETLLDGAMDDKDNLQRFLEIIQRQADRLNDIIEDLLTLARIEQDPDQAITLERVRLLPILEAAVLTCKAQAAAREMSIALRCPGDAEARLNSALFEQAVVNLLDNAIKYSDAGDTIDVTADQHDGETVVSVVDHGCGIARDHLPRLFERFYRVDRARSRPLGGTGLGLAIVKHIMNAHHGRVDVQSASGKGSRFSLHLPGV